MFFSNLYEFGKSFFDPMFPVKNRYEDDFKVDFANSTHANIIANDLHNAYLHDKVVRRFYNILIMLYLGTILYFFFIPTVFHQQEILLIVSCGLLIVYIEKHFSDSRYTLSKGQLVEHVYFVNKLMYFYVIINLVIYFYSKNTFGMLLVLPLVAIFLLVIAQYLNNKKNLLIGKYAKIDTAKKTFFRFFETVRFNSNKNVIVLPFNALHSRFVAMLKIILVTFMAIYTLLFLFLLFKFSFNFFGYFQMSYWYDHSNFHDISKYLYYVGFKSWGLTEFCYSKFNFINMFGKLVISPVFAIEAISLLFMGLTMLLVFLCIFFLWPTFEYDKNIVLYVSQLLLLLSQLNITFTTLDILTFFIAFESLLIPMIIMIAFWGSKNNRQANNYLIFYTMVSAIPMVFAILFLINKTGTTNLFLLFSRMHYLTFMEQSMVWLSFFFAFAVKTPMVPFHIWLPKTHVDAPTVGSVILAGVLLKIGLIGMIRFLFPLLPEVTHFFAPYVAAVATVGVVYASFITLRQIDMKRIIAYSSVAHMNMAMVSLCSLNMVGFYSTVYLMLSHGLIASGLFFLVGFLYNRFHVRSVYYYSGLAMCMPILTVYFFLFTLANMAFPLTSGFIGEFLLLLGISINNFYLGVLNAVNMLLTTVYSVLLFGRVFLGELKVWLEKIVFNYIWTKHNNPNDARQLDLYPYEIYISTILFAGIFVLGIYPQIVFDALNYHAPVVQVLYTHPSFL